MWISTCCELIIGEIVLLADMRVTHQEWKDMQRALAFMGTLVCPSESALQYNVCSYWRTDLHALLKNKNVGWSDREQPLSVAIQHKQQGLWANLLGTAVEDSTALLAENSSVC